MLLQTEKLSQTVEQPQNSGQQTVYLIDDDEDVRTSLKFLLEGYHLTVRTFSSGTEFFDQIEQDIDGCAVIDIRMPGMGGMEVQQRLKEMHVTFPAIMLTAHADVPVAVEAIKQGAFDFILKSASQHEIVTTIQSALKHSRKHHQEVCERNKVRNLMNTLSRRELEVLDLVIEGLTSREISEKLDIKTKTVDAHRANLMRKMNATNVADLINKVVTLRNQDGGAQA